jgi:hypothetical protein
VEVYRCVNSSEIKGLAKATCCWLAYKQLTGFQKFLTEAMLSVPISEFLASRTAWLVTPELYHKKLQNEGQLPDLWFDFAGAKRPGTKYSFILETKLLKVHVNSRIVPITIDFCKLALPLDQRRYFLLAGRSENFCVPGESSEPSNLAHVVLALGVNKGKYVRPRDELARPEFGHFRARLQSMSDVPTSAYVTCLASEEVELENEERFRTVIWRVARTKAG